MAGFARLRVPKAAARVAIFTAAAVAGFSCSDSTGPKTLDAPTDVTVVMATPTSARVTWTAGAQADQVRSYNVFRNGTKIGEVTTTSYVDDGLVELTQYRYAVSANGLSGIVSALSADSPSSVVTAPDVTPPRVTASSPAAGAASVSASATVTATFSEPVDSSTVNTSTFVVRTVAGAAIAGSVTYNSATRIAEFRPSASLPGGTAISVLISGVKDKAGNPLAPAFTMSFTVAVTPQSPGDSVDTTRPVVLSSLPASGAAGVAISSTVGLSFSEAMNAASVNGTTFQVSIDGGGAVAGTVSYDAATLRALFTPSSALQNSTVYRFSATSGMTDVAGNSLVAFSGTFTTVAAADITPPAVVSTTPAAGSTGVAVSVVPTVTFSRAMDPASLNGSTITLSANGSAINASVSYNAATSTVSIVPASALSYATTYTIAVSTGVEGSNGVALPAQFSSTFATVPPPDITPPTVVSASPANGATGVGVTTSVSAVFSRAMNAGTINTSTVTLAPNGGGAVPAVVSFNAGTNTVTLTPSSALAYSTTYTFTITTGVQGSNNVAMISTFTSTFTTSPPRDTTPPTVVATSPASGASNVDINSVVTVTFSEAMDPATVGSASMALKVLSTSATVAGSFAYNASTQVVTFTPSSPLSYSTGYTMIVSTGAKDLAGNAMAAVYSANFTTAAQPVINNPPVILGTSPPNGNSNVATTNPIVNATFNVDLNASTVNSTTFTLTTGGQPVAGTVTYNSTTRQTLFTPSGALANSTTYTATLTTGIKDVNGNTLNSNYTWSFTTVAPGVIDLSGEPNFSGTDAPQEVHLHILFAQNGQNLSLGNCNPSECILAPLNQAGQTIVGPNTPGQVWATIVSLTGTLVNGALNFTLTADNGRTFSFTGTATASNAFSGTFSGATQPPVGLSMAR